ncbi:MAG: DUF1330 domain-containing protein [Bacteroidota bacterium]
MSIFLTQLIYLHKGQEDSFHQFEEIAIPIIAKYNGKLLLRVRPNGKEIIKSNIEEPYEIHLVEFESDKDLESFSKDEERNKALYLKEKAIRSIILIKGNKV